MPIPAAAAVPASTVFLYPAGLHDYTSALPALALMVVPALLMVSTIRFRSFKTIDLQARRSFRILLAIAALFGAILIHPRWTLVGLAYGYLLSAFIGMAMTRLRRRPVEEPPSPAAAEQ
jgi:CDP-diacylglycerol---serine O-phosphatidyltransferase